MRVFKAGDELLIDGVPFRIAAHPSVPGFPYGQEGRQGVVYRLDGPDGPRALKVFKALYRQPALVSLAGKLEAYVELPGLAVCRRRVLIPQQHGALLRQHADLLYAVLMPWVTGPNWMEVMLERRALTPAECLALARGLGEVLAALEQRGVAHCDLSGANLLLPGLVSGAEHPLPVALVDVEQMYGPGLDRPAALPGGSGGYGHRTAGEGLWEASADRFAGAVLLAEILGWAQESVRAAAFGESYFAPGELPGGGAPEGQRYETLVAALRKSWGHPVALLFQQAWRSEALAECPTFGDWLMALPEQVPGREWESAELRQAIAAALAMEERGEVAAALEEYRKACHLASPGSAVAEELALIVRELEGQTPAAPPREAPPTDDAEIAQLFREGRAAAERGERAAALELLNEVARLRPGYQAGGIAVQEVLDQARAPRPPSPRPRKAPSASIRPPISTQTATRVMPLLPLEGRALRVNRVAFSPDGEIIAAGLGDSTVRLWRLADGKPLQPLRGHAGAVQSIAFSPSTGLLASAAHDTTVRIWSPLDGGYLFTLKGHTHEVADVAFSPDGRLIGSCSRDGTARIWEAETGQAVHVLEGHAGGALSLAFSPQGNVLAVGAWDGIRLWRLSSGSLQRWFAGQAGAILSLTYTVDGDDLLSASRDSTIRVWSPRDGSLRRMLTGHTAPVRSLAFTPCGEVLASAGADLTIRLWRYEDGSTLQTLRAHTNHVHTLALSADGCWLASGAYEGVRLWGVR